MPIQYTSRKDVRDRIEFLNYKIQGVRDNIRKSEEGFFLRQATDCEKKAETYLAAARRWKNRQRDLVENRDKHLKEINDAIQERNQLESFISKKTTTKSKTFKDVIRYLPPSVREGFISALRDVDEERAKDILYDFFKTNRESKTDEQGND